MAPSAGTHYTYRTAFGPLTIAATADAITAVALDARDFPGASAPSLLSNRCANQLQEYFAGKRTAFDLPLAVEGSPFQQRVWQALAAIPYGQTRTAADIAAAVGDPEARRAVGIAVRRNPAAVLIPAHRVVSARGTIEGTDRSSELRRACLRLEQAHA